MCGGRWSPTACLLPAHGCRTTAGILEPNKIQQSAPLHDPSRLLLRACGFDASFSNAMLWFAVCWQPCIYGPHVGLCPAGPAVAGCLVWLVLLGVLEVGVKGQSLACSKS